MLKTLKSSSFPTALATGTLAAAALSLATPFAAASDSGPLVDALVKKGVLTSQEGESIRAELAAETYSAIMGSVAKGKSDLSIALSGRIQTQYYGAKTTTVNAAGNAVRLSPVNHFVLRRVYVGVDATLIKNFSASFNYDFSGGSFDKAFLNWADNVGSQQLSVDVGLRKVNFGYEETLSSGSLDAIERSGATRYFVEDNNNRRLGGGSYRIGLFLDGNKAAASGKSEGVFYGAAITNPERVTDSTSFGNRINNAFAYWANLGYTGKTPGLTYTIGAGAGYLPGQGGVGAAATTESADLCVGSVYSALVMGDFALKGEILVARSERDRTLSGAVANTTPWGVWIQPSYKLTDAIELVARYSYLDSDSRGVRVSDGVRSAAASRTFRRLHEYYAGMNYYFCGNDVKLQLGYVGGFGRGVVSGAATRAEVTHGFRTQIQVNF